MPLSSPTAYNPRTSKETDINFSSGSIVLSGYNKRTPSEINNNDLLTEAIGKLESRVENVEENKGLNLGSEAIKINNFAIINSDNVEDVRNGESLNSALSKLNAKANNNADDITAVNNRIDNLGDTYATHEKVTEEIEEKIDDAISGTLNTEEIDREIENKINELSSDLLTAEQVTKMINEKTEDLPTKAQVESTVDDKLVTALSNVPTNAYINEELSKRYNKEETADLIDTKIYQVVDTAPKALDTLKELADALNNDPSFAVTIMDLLAKKLDKADYVDNKVTNTSSNTSVAYVTGTTNSATNTGTQVFDPGVYLTATPGRIHVSSIELDSGIILI